MRPIRFDHIALATPPIGAGPAVLAGELGGTPHHAGSSRVYRFAQWRFQGGGRLEILEPTSDDGFLQRFLTQHGPGIHHVTFMVPSLREVCDRAVAAGYRIVGHDDSNPHWAEAFLHPKEALGIVVQFAESPYVAGAEPGSRRRPAGPAPSPPLVAILGLRTLARSRDRATTQWGHVLQGTLEERDDTLVYRWPRSPLRLTVEIDPAGPEGPTAIDYWSEQPGRLPEGRHPRLGAVFTRCEAREADPTPS